MKSNKTYKIAIVISEFNKVISDNLLKGATDKYNLLCSNISNLEIYKVPGAFEIPGLVTLLLDNSNYDAIVTLGNIIKGETAHFDYISQSVTNAISEISCRSKIPIIFGVLTTYNYEQALERSDCNKKDKGGEVMLAAFSTIDTYSSIKN
tara:strand:+ start:90 stop:539 length:450 start_codon:yes stop_codon:yes gene_type:complete